MDTEAVRQALGLSLGLVVGIATVTLVSDDRPSLSIVLGIACAPVVLLALSSIDGPLEKRTARLGAVVLSLAFVGAALWLRL